jgi:ABC-2 type transport system ATP-binding protein
MFHLGRKGRRASDGDAYIRTHPEDIGGMNNAMLAVLAADRRDLSQMSSLIGKAQEKGRGFGHFHHTAFTNRTRVRPRRQAPEAVKWLEQAAADGYPCYPVFAQDSALDPIGPTSLFSSFWCSANTMGSVEATGALTRVTLPADGPAIAIRDLAKSYGHVHAVRGVTFDVQRGEIFGFLGLNGAGKTTTIRILLDLLRPSRGGHSCSDSTVSGKARSRAPRSATCPASSGLLGHDRSRAARSAGAIERRCARCHAAAEARGRLDWLERISGGRSRVQHRDEAQAWTDPGHATDRPLLIL